RPSPMFQLYRRLKWIYQKFKLSAWLPFAALVSYTVFGAFLFKSFEMDNDQRKRENYRNRTVFAMNQVLERMLEVRCHDPELRIADKAYQAALERLLNRLLEEYIEEIEKMAEIVVQDERMDEEVTPLELRMT
ncbi:hypothetical protein TELCIR_18903, partial [Teladorsagia circumcincta]